MKAKVVRRVQSVGNMKRKQKLKSPFVITLSTIASASLIACGGAPSDGGTSESNLTKAGNDEVSANPPPPPACPEKQPELDSACDLPETACEYNADTSCPTNIICDAATKTWMDTSPSCNPPPVSNCPETMPEQGAACTDLEAGAHCDYSGESICEIAFSCDAETKTWQDVSPSCNPPMPE